MALLLGWTPLNEDEWVAELVHGCGGGQLTIHALLDMEMESFESINRGTVISLHRRGWRLTKQQCVCC
jgi:hypothetical protein